MKKDSLFLGVILAAAGLFMIIWPEGCVKAVVILLGIEALLNGMYQLLYTRKLFPDTTFQYSVLIRGMLSIVVGLLALFLPLRFAAVMWSVMLYVLAFYLLAGSGLLIFSIGKLRDTSVDRRQFVLEALISIVIALIMIIIPIKLGTSLIRIGGTVIFLIGAVYILFYIKNRPEVREPIEVVDDISGDLEKSNE